MAVRRRQFRKKRRVVNRRRRFNKRKYTANMTKQISGVPDVTFVKMKSTKMFNLQGDIGSLGTAWITMYGNYPFAAFAGITGNPIPIPITAADIPIGYSTWSSLYTRQLTTATKVLIRLVPNGTTANMKCSLIAMDANAPIPMTIQAINGLPYATTRLICGAGSQQQAVFKKYMKSKRMFGVNHLDITDFSGPVNSIPVQRWYFYFQADVINITDIVDVDVQVELTYYVKFFERKNLIS